MSHWPKVGAGPGGGGAKADDSHSMRLLELGSLEISTGPKWGQILGRDRPMVREWPKPEMKGIRELVAQDIDGRGSTIHGEEGLRNEG